MYEISHLVFFHVQMCSASFPVTSCSSYQQYQDVIDLSGYCRMSVPDWSTVVHSCTDLLVLLQLRVVDPSDLAEFGSVVRVLDGVISSHSHCCCCRSNRRCPAPFLRSGHALCQQHVIQTHELRIRRVFILTATDTETWHNTANVNRDNRQRLFGYFQVRLLLNITVWKHSGSQH